MINKEGTLPAPALPASVRLARAVIGGMLTDAADLAFAKVVQQHFYAPENIHFQRLLIQVLVQKPELYITLEQRPSGRVLQALSDILAQKQDEGLLTLSDPQLQATAFLGAIMGYPLPGALIAQNALAQKRLQLAECAISVFLTAWD
jgi:hypothetical protein